MQKVFEKIIERLEDESMMLATSKKFWDNPQNGEYVCCAVDIETAIKIVKQVSSEYGGGWIPVSERLPEESGEYLTWVRYDGREFRAIDEIDCDGIVKEWNCSSDYKIIAWQPLPEAYKSEEE